MLVKQTLASLLSPFLLNTSPLRLSSGVAERVTFKGRLWAPSPGLGLPQSNPGLEGLRL